jgi:SAM-dependent methyltransferase
LSNDFPTNSFDIVIANNALHHVVSCGMLSVNQQARNEYVQTMRELRRLLKPIGVLLIWEYSRISFWRWSPLKFKWREIDWDRHPTFNEWVSVVREAGFRFVSHRYCVPYRLRSFHSLFANPVSQFLTNAGFVIKAMK